MLGDPDRTGASETRVLPFGKGIFYAVQARASADPEIAVKRDPVSRLEVVTQVPFEGSHGILRLRPRPRIVGIPRKEIVIRGEEPHSGVAIDNPFAPALGIAEFRLEGAAVGAPINQLCWIVLASRSNHFQTDA